MTNIIVDGKKYSVEDGITILDACKQIGIYIPTLCYLKEFGATSSCRVCLVEVVGQRNSITSCSFKIFEGMEVTRLFFRAFVRCFGVCYIQTVLFL